MRRGRNGAIYIATPAMSTRMHDRAVVPEQLTYRVQGEGTVFLMAATLRPETMAGQTNCWVLPEGEYGAYRGLNNEIYVLTARAARNLAYQDKLPKTGEPELLLPLAGQDLIGVPLKVISCLRMHSFIDH